MRRALRLARGGWGRVAPNPLVGAVVVQNGDVVGEGFHAEYGGAHAEVAALRAAGERAHGATLYVTLEPCSHHGKTPPCTDAVIAAGVARVVYAAADPNRRAAGGGERLRAAGIVVSEQVRETEARDLNAAFFHRFAIPEPDRPWLELKLALSLDARVADANGRSAWITGEAARAEVHRLRAGHDAVAVGIGTVLADDPRLTVRCGTVPRLPPVRIVFDRALRTPLRSALVRSAAEVPVWVIGAPGADRGRARELRERGARVFAAGGLADALRQIRAAGVHSLLCEGGAALAGALLTERLVHRLHLFYAPLFLGRDGIAAFDALASTALADAERWRRVATRAFGADTLVSLQA